MKNLAVANIYYIGSGAGYCLCTHVTKLNHFEKYSKTMASAEDCRQKCCTEDGGVMWIYLDQSTQTDDQAKACRDYKIW